MCLQMLNVKVFRYMDIVLAILGIPTHYYFGPRRHLSFVSTKFEIKPVLACWQQQMHGQNKVKVTVVLLLAKKAEGSFFKGQRKRNYSRQAQHFLHKYGHWEVLSGSDDDNG